MSIFVIRTLDPDRYSAYSKMLDQIPYLINKDPKGLLYFSGVAAGGVPVLRGGEQRADADGSVLPAGRGGAPPLCLQPGRPHVRRLGRRCRRSLWALHLSSR